MVHIAQPITNPRPRMKWCGGAHHSSSLSFALATPRGENGGDSRSSRFKRNIVVVVCGLLVLRNRFTDTRARSRPSGPSGPGHDESPRARRAARPSPVAIDRSARRRAAAARMGTRGLPRGVVVSSSSIRVVRVDARILSEEEARLVWSRLVRSRRDTRGQVLVVLLVLVIRLVAVAKRL